MASLHFVVSAPVVAADQNSNSQGRSLALGVEVEGSAPIKSRAELIRAARQICAEEISRVAGEGQQLGDFTVTETKEIEKNRDPGLTHDAWPGVYVWRVAEESAMAA